MTREDIRQVRQRRYLGRDFASMRKTLIEDAKTYYPQQIQDFSEAGLGGLLIDAAATVGDNMGFYLDHQFAELDPELAVEDVNIERALRNAGVPIVGASPAIVKLTFTLEIPANYTTSTAKIATEALPILRTGSRFSSDNGVKFNLLHDVDFSPLDAKGNPLCTYAIGKKNQDGTIRSYIVTMEGDCVSGEITSDKIAIGANFVPYRQISLSQRDVSEIISVVDDNGNKYYEVTDLTHDTVFIAVQNPAYDSDIVPNALKALAAPYRFVKRVSLSTRATTLVLGGGNAETFEDDAIPDPADIALPYAYRSNFPIEALDPSSLLATKTLGVYSLNTNLTITYRYGGGLQHNAQPRSVKNVDTVSMIFPGNPSFSVSKSVRSSLAVNNNERGSGGDDAPTIDELRSRIGAYRNAQSRIVTREDLIARVYSLPSSYGRVFRSGVSPSPTSAFATRLHIVSRDNEGHLCQCPDTLKKNLRTYLNPYKVIADSVDILDVSIINLGLTFEISVDNVENRPVVIAQVLAALKKYFSIKNWNVNQAIVMSEIHDIIFSTSGVTSVNAIQFRTITGILNNREYSAFAFDVAANTRKGVLLPPLGGMFEIKYPDIDIVGVAT